MRVREFYLINEKGQNYSLIDLKNYCFLTSPSGLGYSYSSEYEKIGSSFIESFRGIQKGTITGTLNFINYDNYKSLVDFIEMSENLKLAYKIPFKEKTKEYFKDVNIQSISKTQKQLNGIISEAVTFDCLSLWYEENTFIHKIEPQNNEIRWDFRWDSKFSDYNTRSLQYINKGHIEAPIVVEMDGYLKNPKIELYVEGQLYQTVTFNTTIAQYEKLLYGTKETEFYIKKQNTDGTLMGLFDLDIINFENDNVIRLPKNKSCELKLTADNEVLNAQVTIFTYYKAV